MYWPLNVSAVAANRSLLTPTSAVPVVALHFFNKILVVAFTIMPERLTTAVIASAALAPITQTPSLLPAVKGRPAI